MNAHSRIAATGTFRLFGLILHSNVPLDELAPCGEAPADIRIVSAGTRPIEGEQGLSKNGARLVLTVAGLARFTVSHDEIAVETAPGASQRNVRLYLLGSAMGALLHQRGLLPLHANAIGVVGASGGARAVAFMGASGAGKSTIAAWFGDRGHRVLADDVCVLGFGKDGVIAQPGLPRLRLWKDALDERRLDPANYPRSFDDMEKYDIPTKQADATAIPLAAIYRLERSDDARIVRLTGAAAVEALVANTYRGAYLQHIGGAARHLADCIRLAREVPVFSAGRAWGFDRFDAEASALETHALSSLDFLKSA